MDYRNHDMIDTLSPRSLGKMYFVWETMEPLDLIEDI